MHVKLNYNVLILVIFGIILRLLLDQTSEQTFIKCEYNIILPLSQSFCRVKVHSIDCHSI